MNWINLPVGFLYLIFRLSLGEEYYRKLTATDPDVIISAGSSMAAPNIFWGKIKGAKSISCGIPSLIGVYPFDLAFVPINKNPPQRENVSVTMGTAHRLVKEKIREEVSRWKKRSELRGEIKNPCIGLILGGPVRNLEMDSGFLIKVLREIKNFAQENDGEIISATSRRTPNEVEKALRNELGASEVCRFLILAGEEKENPIPMMAGLCDLLVVSEDSATMISELASSHPRVLVTGLKKKRKNRSVASDARLGPLLAAEGYLEYFPEFSLDKEGEMAWRLKQMWNKENNKERLAEAERCAREIEKRFLRPGEGADGNEGSFNPAPNE